MKVRYKKIGEYQGPEMTIGKDYDVLGIEGNYYRVIDDSGKPYLYDPEQFEVLDNSEPKCWCTEYIDGDRYSYPKKWNQRGFFEDYHDGVQDVIDQFWHDCKELYGIDKGTA